VTPQFPGHDEITLTVPRQPQLCHSRAHRESGCPAELIVTFGVFADPGAGAFSPGALWPESWGHAYPMCAECWDHTRRTVATYRPALRVSDLTVSTG